MPKQEITEEEILSIINQMVAQWGSQRKVADHLGISAAFLSDMIHGNKPVSNQVAQKLGYKKIIKYARDSNSQ